MPDPNAHRGGGTCMDKNARFFFGMAGVLLHPQFAETLFWVPNVLSNDFPVVIGYALLLSAPELLSERRGGGRRAFENGLSGLCGGKRGAHGNGRNGVAAGRKRLHVAVYVPERSLCCKADRRLLRGRSPVCTAFASRSQTEAVKIASGGALPRRLTYSKCFSIPQPLSRRCRCSPPA